MKKQWAMSRHDGWYVDYSRRDREWERKRESETQRFIINNDIYIFFFSTSAAAYRRRRFDDWEPRWSDTTCNIDATFYFVKQFVVFFFFLHFFSHAHFIYRASKRKKWKATIHPRWISLLSYRNALNKPPKLPGGAGDPRQSPTNYITIKYEENIYVFVTWIVWNVCIFEKRRWYFCYDSRWQRAQTMTKRWRTVGVTTNDVGRR